ncbi:hypothetical protein PJL18_02408 [Paenarthrobacter nicotinovorans]|nr:hypothetical protein [Paenarthrobacter nicotinovorans]
MAGSTARCCTIRWRIWRLRAGETIWRRASLYIGCHIFNGLPGPFVGITSLLSIKARTVSLPTSASSKAAGTGSDKAMTNIASRSASLVRSTLFRTTSARFSPLPEGSRVRSQTPFRRTRFPSALVSSRRQRNSSGLPSDNPCSTSTALAMTVPPRVFSTSSVAVSLSRG